MCAALCYNAWSTMIHTEWGSKPSLLYYCRLDIARSHSPHPEHKAALHQEVIYSTAHYLKTSGNACVHTKDGQSQPSFHHIQSQCPMVNVTRCCASPRHLLGMQISQLLHWLLCLLGQKIQLLPLHTYHLSISPALRFIR